MKADSVQVKVSIMEREYQLVCGEGEQQELIAAAAYLDEKMREMKVRGNVIGTDRLAVVSALNIAHELLTLRNEQTTLSDDSTRLEEISSSVQKTLNDGIE